MESTDAVETSAGGGRWPGRIAWSFIAAWAVLSVAVQFLALVDVPWPLGDPAVQNLLTLIFGFLAVATGWGWFVFFSGYSARARWRTVAGTVVVVLVGLGLFRVVEVTGSMVPTFAVRWGWLSPDHRLGRLAPLTPEEPIDLVTTTAADYSQFLGPERSCWVARPKLGRDWEVNGPKEIWRQAIGAGWSAFSAVNGYAVTLEQRGKEEWVTCYEVATGKPVWGHAIEARHENALGGVGPRSTPTIHGGRVYALGATGVLRCLDGGTGKLIWSDDLRRRYGVDGVSGFGGMVLDETLVSWGRSASPLIVERATDGANPHPATSSPPSPKGRGFLVVVPGGGVAGAAKNLVAFEAESGRLVWESECLTEAGSADQISYASPALAALGGRRQILIVNEVTASGHDPETGAALWSFPWPGGSSSMASASQAVAIDERRVLLTKGYGGGAEMIEFGQEADGTRSVPITVWKSARSLQTKITNVVVHAGHAYGLSEGVLECVELNEGKRKWKQGRFGHGQILGVGDLLLVLSETGELSLVELNPAKFRLLGSVPALMGKTWNNLCLFGRTLLVRNGQEAACLELPVEK